jgi:hypothetical protein
MNEQFPQPSNENFDPSEKESPQPQMAQSDPPSEKPKAPIPVRILAILMMLGGVSSMAYLIYFSILSATQSLNYPWLIRITLFIFAATIMAAAWGLRDMKKWGLYLVVLWTIFTVIFSLLGIIRNPSTFFSNLIYILVDGAIAGYLIAIRNKFEPEKPHRPALMASMAAVALIIPVISLFALASFQKTPEKELQTMKMDALDSSVEENVSHESIALMDYDIQHDSYSGFSVDPKDTKDWESTVGQYCQTSLKVDISPDGKKFVVHQPLCSDPKKSACVENDMSDSIVTDTAKVEKNYSCK